MLPLEQASAYDLVHAFGADVIILGALGFLCAISFVLMKRIDREVQKRVSMLKLARDLLSAHYTAASQLIADDATPDCLVKIVKSVSRVATKRRLAKRFATSVLFARTNWYAQSHKEREDYAELAQTLASVPSLTLGTRL